MKFHVRLGLLCLVLLLSFGWTYETSEDEVIYWKEGRKLTWNDFKGSPPFGYHYDAETSTGIGYSYTPVRKGNAVIIEWDVHCYFDKKRSWVRRDKKISTLLIHEQGHFDITELYARELRKELKKVPFTKYNVKQLIELHYQKALKEMQDFNHAYAKATRHGINSKIQKQWDEMIHQELTKLVAYKSS